jgi:hypothetical protein
MIWTGILTLNTTAVTRYAAGNFKMIYALEALKAMVRGSIDETKTAVVTSPEE